MNGSFALHLHGPWGAGKTSLLNLLREELRPSPNSTPTAGPAGPGNPAAPQTDSRWVVVQFNAWQHQRLDPPWWFLMDAVYRQACEQIPARPGGWWHAGRLWLYETAWRTFTGRRDIVGVLGAFLLAAGVICLCLLGAENLHLPLLSTVLQWATPLHSDVDYGKAAQAISAVLALVSTLLSAALLLSRSLLSGSARAAQAFVQSGADPMEHVSRHFRNLVAMIDHPILILIDDLDRCQGSYVVHLLEGIQTLFPDPRVFYLVAADRRWLYTCFEKQYEQFAITVTEPGRQLGSLFLEKAFEVSVSVPRLSLERQELYWRGLLRRAPRAAAEDDESLEEQAREEFTAAETEHEVIALLGRKAPSPIKQQAREQAAVERMTSARVEQTTRYFLEEFAQLLEPNPRAMKRLLNAYSVYRDFALLGGIHEVLANVEMRKKLVLWTIVCLRWPTLEEYLIERAAGKSEDAHPVHELLRVEEAPPELHTLLASGAVQKVLKGDGVGAALDFKSINVLAGLRTPDMHTAGIVA